ncbi:hypothetical protein [Actinospongicola halichondriae]|uniref:hypothetical protein n=1 Tax=Actinospongicola halichondriae TaxID=3236844 RepID=UPI003D556CC0
MSDDRIWSAEELEKLTPAERQRLLDERVVTDLSTLPDEFVDRIRREGRTLMEHRGTTSRASDGG